MRIDAVRLTGREIITMPIQGMNNDTRYKLSAYDGLGPPDVDVYISEVGYHNREPQNRQSVFRIGLNPAFLEDETAADLRAELYGLLNPGVVDRVILDLMYQGAVVATTWGWVKKFEVVSFTKDPEVQITLQCDSPYFTGVEELELIAAEDTKSDVSIGVLHNPGDAPTGFYAEWEIAAGDIGNWFGLYDGDGNNLVTLGSFTHNWSVGDRIKINTNKGERDVIWEDGGVDKSALHLLSSDSIWPQLQPGDNVIQTYVFNYSWWQTFRFTPKYWGT